VAEGVPAVMYGAGSVFDSPMARDWLILLLALEQTRQQTVRQVDFLDAWIGSEALDLVADVADRCAIVESLQRKLTSLRRGVLDLYISDHPLECVSCPANGHCELQNMADEVGIHGVLRLTPEPMPAHPSDSVPQPVPRGEPVSAP